MSRPIQGKPLPPPATGIECPNIIISKLFGVDIDKIGRAVITHVTENHMIFQVATEGKISRDEAVGGNYVYESHWEPRILVRQELIKYEARLALYDAVIMTTTHWGPPAEMSLTFLAKTLE